MIIQKVATENVAPIDPLTFLEALVVRSLWSASVRSPSPLEILAMPS